MTRTRDPQLSFADLEFLSQNVKLEPVLQAISNFIDEHAELVEHSSNGSLAGEIYVVEPLGNETLVAIDVGNALVNVRQPADFSMSVGSRCGIRPIARHLHLFDHETGVALKTGDVKAA